MAIPAWAESWLQDGGYQDILIEWEYASGSTENIYSRSVVTGTFNIDRKCVSGDTIELGSVIAATLKMSLLTDNITHIADMQVGQTMKPQVVIEDDSADLLFVPCGTFFISSIEKQDDDLLNIECLDTLGMNGDRQMDVDTYGHKLTIHIGAIARELTGQQTWRYNGDSTNANADVVVTSYTGESLPTYREYLGWAAFLLGCFVRTEADGRIGFVPLINDVGTTSFTVAERYNSKLDEKYGKIKRVIYRAGEYNIVVGSYTPPDPYTTWDIIYTTEILLTFAEDLYDMIAEVLNTIDGFEWRPLETTTYGAPHLLPGDRIIYIDETQGNIGTMITSITYGLNKNSVIKCAKPQP